MTRGIAVAILAFAAPAAAQEGVPKAEPTEIRAPRARNTALEYPAGGQGDATVMLELLVGASGKVESCKVLEGEAAFGAAACAQARENFVFEPATRGGRPLAARIRFEARFTEQRVETAPDKSPEPPAPTTKPEGVKQGDPTEILVRGERRPVDVTTLRRAEIRELPGAFGDPFRAIEAQPGVTPVISGLPYFFLRGAPPGNVGYFVDGLRVPMLYHAFVGPAVIHPGFINSTEIFRGGYPARYGRFAGGIVAAETTPPAERARGEAHARLFDAGAMFEAPFAGDKGSIALAGRYSYTALLLSLLVLDDTQLEYWDYQARASYDFTPSDRLSVLGFGAYDFSGSKTRESLGSLEFHRFDLRYDRRLGPNTSARLAGSFGLDQTRVSEESSLDARSFGGRLDLRHELGKSAALRLGGDLLVEHYELNLEDVIGLDEIAPPRQDLTTGVYAELALSPEEWLSFTPGIRTDIYRTDDGRTDVAVEPRVAAVFEVTPSLRISHTFGLAHQPPNFLPPIFPALSQPDVEGGLQESIQASSGFAVDLPLDVTVSVAAFDNIFLDVTDPVGTTGEIDVDTLRVRSLGHAYGLEFHLSRPLTRRLGGFVSYTLSRSTRSHDTIESLSAFDRTHVLNLALGYDLGRHWRAGARLTFLSGVPTRRGTTRGPIFEDERAPAFYRVDARLEKRWMLGESAWVGLVAEVLNASASEEVVRRNCNDIGCTNSVFGPIVLPSLGVEAAF